MSIGARILLLGFALFAPVSAWASDNRTASFGSFAGYLWLGHVWSVHASWTVPRVRRGSPAGIGATWIGAQTAIPHGAFLQIGTVEEGFWPKHRRRALNRDVAFWSDTDHHYRAQFIFVVGPGDRVSASMRLATGRWMLSIRDLTSGARAHISTPEEASASFAQAEWLQEDPRSGLDHAPVSYPKLSDVRFGGLEVDARRPSYAALYATWMSLRRIALAPSPLREGSFYVHRARPISQAGARYLRIAAIEDRAEQAFAAEMNGWSQTTPIARVTAERTRFAAAMRSNIHALASAGWPTPIAPLVTELVRAARALRAQTDAAPHMTASRLDSWKARWHKDAAALGHVAHRLRRALQVPEATPKTKAFRRIRQPRAARTVANNAEALSAVLDHNTETVRSASAPGENRTPDLRFERPPLFGSPWRTVDH